MLEITVDAAGKPTIRLATEADRIFANAPVTTSPSGRYAAVVLSTRRGGKDAAQGRADLTNDLAVVDLETHRLLALAPLPGAPGLAQSDIAGLHNPSYWRPSAPHSLTFLRDGAVWVFDPETGAQRLPQAPCTWGCPYPRDPVALVGGATAPDGYELPYAFFRRPAPPVVGPNKQPIEGTDANLSVRSVQLHNGRYEGSVVQNALPDVHGSADVQVIASRARTAVIAADNRQNNWWWVAW
jgi:hypothetical protein